MLEIYFYSKYLSSNTLQQRTNCICLLYVYTHTYTPTNTHRYIGEKTVIFLHYIFAHSLDRHENSYMYNKYFFCRFCSYFSACLLLGAATVPFSVWRHCSVCLCAIMLAYTHWLKLIVVVVVAFVIAAYYVWTLFVQHLRRHLA